MPLYRVTHRRIVDGVSFINSVVADNPAEAIGLREVTLDLDEHDPAYDATVEAVADPDGSRAASWLRHFGKDWT